MENMHIVILRNTMNHVGRVYDYQLHMEKLLKYNEFKKAKDGEKKKHKMGNANKMYKRWNFKPKCITNYIKYMWTKCFD